jgi:hypothetical protein
MLRDREPGTNAWLMMAPVLVLAFVPLVGNRLTASRAGETLARASVRDLLQSVPPNSILITAGDNDTFPLWYMQEVENVRRDVLLANISLMGTEWHNKQLKRRNVVPLDTASLHPIYRDSTWTAPTHEAISWSYEQIEALPFFQQLTERTVFRAGDLRLVLTPQVLTRPEIVALHLIQQNLGRRPVYFSRTTGSYADQLGLTPYLRGEGLVRRVMPDSIAADSTVLRMGPLGWVDLPRTDTLLFEVYHPEAAARARPRGWPDTPSEGILWLYALLYANQAQYLAALAADSQAVAADPELLNRLERATDIAERTFSQTEQYRGGAFGF